MRGILSRVVAISATVALACSCTDEQTPNGAVDSPAAVTEPSDKSSSIDSTEAAQQQALAAYRGMWSAFAEAGRLADPQHPDLARYTAGDALELLVSGIEANREEGLVSDGDEVGLDPEVVEVAPQDAPVRVSVVDCADTSETRRIRPSGPPFEDSPGGWRRVSAEVELLDDAWKVTELAVQEVGSCGPEQ